MSKFLKIMIVLLTIAAFAAPAFASDLSITGQVRVEGYYIDAETDGAGDPEAYFDQRFRVNPVWQVSDDVKAELRVDFGEAQWGSAGLNTIRNNPGNFGQMHIDKAYLKVDKEMFSISAGQQFFGLGNTIAVDHVGTGFIFSLNTPVTFKAMWTKVDENGSFTDESSLNTEDTDFYAADVGHVGENYSANLFYAMLDDKSTDDNRSVIGLAVDYNLEAFKIMAELNFYDGDNGAGTDYMGTQAYVDVSTAVSEAMAVGGFFLYAAGDDEDIQITEITDWASWMPETYGYLATMQYVYGETFNPFGLGAGIIAPALYATFQASDDLGFKAMAQYIMEEDDAAGEFDGMNLNVSTKYAFAKNTNLIAQVNYFDGEANDVDQESLGLWTQLQVNF